MRTMNLGALASAAPLALLLGLAAPALGAEAIPAPAQAAPVAGPQALDLLDQGELAAAAGDFGQAEARWKQALQVKPGWSTAQRRLAELLQRRRAFPHEQAERQRRVKARLDYVEGITAFNAGDYGRAAGLFQGASQALPEDQVIARELARARELEKAVRQGSLKVVCGQKAAVILDGKRVGETPLTLEAVPVGRHHLALEDFGARTAQDVEIKPRSHTEITMNVLGGRVVVKCPLGSEVFFDGKAMGKGPLELWNLPVGHHLLEIRCPVRPPQAREVVLRAGERPEMEFGPAQP